MFFWSYLPVLKILALHCNACSRVLQFKLGNKLHLCNRFSESCAFGYGWTSSGKPYCSCLKIFVSRLLCLSAKDRCPHHRAAGQSTSGPSRTAAAARGHVRWACGHRRLNGPSRCRELRACRAALCCAGSVRGAVAAFRMVGERLFKSLVISVCPLLPSRSLQIPLPGRSKLACW